MTDLINIHLTKAIVDIALFLEFTPEDLIDSDASMQAMEQLAAELQLMSAQHRDAFITQIRNISVEYSNAEKNSFINSLPETFGLE